MSRQIDLTRELTEDERNYLLDRGWQHMLDENALNLMGGGVDEDEIEEPETPDTSSSTGVENPPAPAAIEPPPVAVGEKTETGAAAGADDESE